MNRHHLFMLLALSFGTADAVTFAQPAPGGSCMHRNGPFAWNCSGPVRGMSCTQIIEIADPNTWNDNYFCSSTDIGMRWSSSAPVPGMTCTQIIEIADPHTWNDNYLCLPPDSTTRFRWSSHGRISGMQCVQWDEPADPHTWNDNFLCWSTVTPPPPPPEVTERQDHRCGPSFDNARCGTRRCCSTSDWCGNLNEPHCGAQRGYSGRFDGPR